MANRLEHLKTVLRDTLRAPPPEMPRRWHKDDDYWDSITVECPTGPTLTARMEPRFKTSGLSGDEWRVRAALKVVVRRTGPVDFDQRAEPPVLLERGYHRMRDLLQYAPFHVYEALRASPSRQTRALFELPKATLTVHRKGVLLFQEERPNFGDAVIGVGWHILTSNEGRPGVAWHHLTEEEERARCQQVGCAAAPRNFYRLKKLQVAPNEDVMVEPKYDFTGQFTWYCGRHTLRGDAGYEDADKNLGLVSGPGDGEPESADESPAALRVLQV